MARCGRLLCLMAACLAVASAASATPINVTGSWSYTINGEGFTNQVFSGSASFTYDDSSITGTGVEYIEPIALTAFTQTPSTIGAITFSAANSVASVRFTNGVLDQTFVGGVSSGGARNAFGTTDDFRLIANSGGLAAFAPEALITVATTTGHAFATGETASFTHTAVPEPGSLALLGSGAAGMAGWASRRRRGGQALASW